MLICQCQCTFSTWVVPVLRNCSGQCQEMQPRLRLAAWRGPAGVHPQRCAWYWSIQQGLWALTGCHIAGHVATHLQAAAASMQRLLAVATYPQQLVAGQEGQLVQPSLQQQSTQPLGSAAAASAQPGSSEAGLSQGSQVAQHAEAAHGPQEGVATDSATTAAGDPSQSRQAAGTHQPPGLSAAAAPPQQPKGAARQLPEFSSSEPSGALSSVLAGPSLQAPGRGSGHLAVKEPAATPADQIQDVNRDILELLQRVRPPPSRRAHLAGAHMRCCQLATGRQLQLSCACYCC